MKVNIIKNIILTTLVLGVGYFVFNQLPDGTLQDSFKVSMSSPVIYFTFPLLIFMTFIVGYGFLYVQLPLYAGNIDKKEAERRISKLIVWGKNRK